MNIELILAIVLGVAIILLIGYKYMNRKTSESKESKETQEDETNTVETTKKVLKYFGGDYCPFSNSNSNAYKVVKDFEAEYGDKVDVEFYWVGLDDEIMKELNVEYVPYLLNGDNKQIEIALPEGTDASNMEEAQLKELLLRTIYEKL